MTLSDTNQVLGLPAAEVATIKVAYRMQVRATHPETWNAAEGTKQNVEADVRVYKTVHREIARINPPLDGAASPEASNLGTHQSVEPSALQGEGKIKSLEEERTNFGDDDASSISAIDPEMPHYSKKPTEFGSENKQHEAAAESDPFASRPVHAEPAVPSLYLDPVCSSDEDTFLAYLGDALAGTTDLTADMKPKPSETEAFFDADLDHWVRNCPKSVAVRAAERASEPSQFDVPEAVPHEVLLRRVCSSRGQRPFSPLPAAFKRHRKTGTTAALCGAGRGTFGIALSEHMPHVTVVHPDHAIVDVMKARVLGCEGAYRAAVEKGAAQGLYGRKNPILRDHVSHHTTRYVAMPAERTGLPAHHYDLIIVNQAHRVADLPRVIAEVQRLAAPGATVVLMGVMQPRINPVIDRILYDGLANGLKRHLTKADRTIMSGFQNIEFPFVGHEYDRSGDSAHKHLDLIAKWNLPEFMCYLNDWPLIRGIRRRSDLTHFQVAGMYSVLTKAWGSKKTRREVTLPLKLRVGFAP